MPDAPRNDLPPLEPRVRWLGCLLAAGLFVAAVAVLAHVVETLLSVDP
jgi:hypothetical protein